MIRAQFRSRPSADSATATRRPPEPRGSRCRRLLSLAPAAEHEATEREAKPERADGEAADGECFTPGRQALPAAQRPVLAIPGNHDIPYTFPARFTRSFQEFERQWETTEPTYSSPTLHVIGLNSVRPWRHQSGGVRTAQLERAEERLRDAAPGAFQIV